MTIQTDKVIRKMENRTHSPVYTKYAQINLIKAASIHYRTQNESYVYIPYVVRAFRSFLLVVGLSLVSSFIPVYSESNLTGSSAHSDYAHNIADHKQIDLSAIAQIESSGRASAVGDGGKALGLFQIHPPVVQDYNKFNKASFTHKDMLEPVKARLVADWYLNKRIPALLAHYSLPDTPYFRIRAYNEGFLRSIKGRQPSRITRAYIERYNKLTKKESVK